MNCSSCGYANEEGAKACNLCAKLLAAKPAAPAPAAVAAPLPAADPGRIPSWPNRAILCFLVIPALTLIAAPLLLRPGEYEDPDADRSALQQLAGMILIAAGCLSATLPLAARLSVAPIAATALSGIFFLIGTFVTDRPFSMVLWPILGAIGMVWFDRSAYTRTLDPARLPVRAFLGYKRLLQQDRWAPLRLIGGIALFLGGIVFMMAAGTAIGRHIGLSRPLAKLLAIPAFLGGFLAASGLSLSEAPESKPPE